MEQESSTDSIEGVFLVEPHAGAANGDDQAIGKIIKRLQKQASVAPITRPNERGAFGDVLLLPAVFPMVIDANALRDELLRTVRTGERTILCTAANGGVLRLFCAEHVVYEVNKHAARWATDRGLDPAAVLATWRTSYLPLLRCVTLPEGLTTKAESLRLAVLADPTSPYGDLDDVPTATLGTLLGAPILSRDRNLLRAAYGPEFDHEAHGRWLAALAAGGNLGPLTQYVQLGTNLIAGAGQGLYAAIRALADRTSWPAVLALAFGAAALGSIATSTEQRQRALHRTGRILAGAATTFGELVALQRAAQDEFETLATPQPAWDDLRSDLGDNRALTRYCLHELARSAKSHLSAAELRERIKVPPQIPHGEAKIRAVLRDGCCFEQVYQGRFQVGRALVR